MTNTLPLTTLRRANADNAQRDIGTFGILADVHGPLSDTYHANVTEKLHELAWAESVGAAARYDWYPQPSASR